MSDPQREAMQRQYDIELEGQRPVDSLGGGWREARPEWSLQQLPPEVQVKIEQSGNANDIPSYVNKIKAHFPGRQHIWHEFSCIMQTNRPAHELLPEVAHLLRDIPELIRDFTTLMGAFDQARNIHGTGTIPPTASPLTPSSISRGRSTAHRTPLAIRSNNYTSPTQLPRFRMPSSDASDDQDDGVDAEHDNALLDRKADLEGDHIGAVDANVYEHLQKTQDAQREHIQKLLVLPAIDIPREERRKTPVAMSCVLMEHQKVCLTWLIEQEENRHKRGGLLADAMGLGKTIQALALILARPSTNSARKTTLILAPLALLKQWEQEIKTKVKPRYELKTLILHGSTTRTMTVSKMLTYDVVMTTYGTLVSEYKRHSQRKAKRLLLLSKDTIFHRIILDEAHNIKNRHGKASIAVTFLKATYRLCMTGTPFMNRTAEIFPIIRFLRISPFNHWENFNEDIEKPLKRRDGHEANQAIRKLQALFRSFTLRRSKTSKLDGKLILQLPEKTIETAQAEFDEEQQIFYDALEQKQQLKLNKYIKLGTVGKNYTYILVLLLRLRQACDHPHLIKDHGIPDGTQLTAEQMCQLALEFDDDVVARLKGQKDFRCPSCEEVTENPMLIHPCGHHICGSCFTAMMELRNPNFNIRDGGDDADEADSRQSPCLVRTCRSEIDPERVVCHNFFVEAYTQDKSEEQFSEDESEITENSEETEDDEVDELGNLKDFIVSDGEESDVDDGAAVEDDKTKNDHPFKDEELGESSRSMGEVWADVAKHKASSTGQSMDDSDNDSLPSLEGVWKQAMEAKAKGEPVLKTEWDIGTLTPVATSKTKRKRPKNEKSAEAKKKARMKSEDVDTKGKSLSRKIDKKEETNISRPIDKQGKKKKKAFMSLADLKKAGSRNAAAKAKYLQRLRQEYIPSAKINKTMELLRSIRKKEPREKTLVFSLWTSFLDILEIPIADEGFKYTRYDGGMNPADRDSAIKSFMEDPQVDVMLVSLMAGNAGLNLTMASQVIVLEPFWNPYVEDQAIDRAHRIGQKKNVTVHRVLISGTVEDRILELQQSKRELVDAALSEEGAQGVGRLSLRQLKGLFGF